MLTTRIKTAAGTMVKVLYLVVAQTAWAEHEQAYRTEGPKTSSRSIDRGRVRL